jgi:hypothetical protein
MKYNALAVMAIASGLAQAHRLNWQSESQAVVEHERREFSDPAFKIDIGEKHGKEVNNDVTDKVEKKGDDEHAELVIRGSKEDIKSKVSTSAEAEKKKLKKLKEELKEIEAEEEEEEKEEKDHYDDPYPHDPVVTSYPNHYNHRGHRYEGKKYDFTHEPKVYHHTSYITHEPKLSPDCHGDRCDRKPCNKCNGDWAQPGCWHCKNHEQENAEEGNYEKVTSTGEAAPEKTKGKYYNAKTYTYGDRTIIVPKETKAPKPEETYKKEGPKIVVIEKPVVVEKPKHEQKEKPKVVVVEKPKHEYPKEKPKVVVVEKPKHEYPKHEHKEVDICKQAGQQHKHGESPCDKIHHHKQEHKEVDICKQAGQHKHGENPCDKIHHHKQEQPKPEPPKVHYKKPDIICEGGCNIHQGAAPAPAPAPAHPQPEQKKYEEAKPMPAPVPAPAPAPQQPEQKKDEEVKPMPAPAPVPAKPEVVKPEAGNGNTPLVPVTVPKSGANYVVVSVGTAVFAGFVSMMLL